MRTSSSTQAYYPPHMPPPPPGSSRARSHSGRSAVGRQPEPSMETALALAPYKPPPPPEASPAEYPPQHYGPPGAYHGYGRPGPPPQPHYGDSQALTQVAPAHLQYIPRQPMQNPHYYGMYPPGPDGLYPPEVQYSPPTSKGVSPIRPTYSPPPAPPSAPRSERSGLVRRKNEPALVVFPVDCPWPPPCGPDGILTAGEARRWIATGTPMFRGKVIPVRMAPPGHCHFFAFATKSAEAEWEDCAPSMNEYDAFEDMSSALLPVHSIEKPAMSGSHGLYAGTVTISYYTASFSSDIKVIETPPYKVKLRKVTMLYVLEQLQYLEKKGGFDDVDPMHLHRNLYGGLLHENPNADPRFRFTLHAQISDLCMALMRPTWVNYALPDNQLVSRFFHNAPAEVTTNFFHQLLLSVELHLRIVALQLDEPYDPLVMLPEKVNWDLVLAKRWLEKVSVVPPRKMNREYFIFKYKEQQIEVLRNFAFTLKWPNLFEIRETLDASEEEEGELEEKSVYCMAWFTGVMLPGKSIPWIVMNALIDCDPDCREELDSLPMHEPIGLQYRGSSYWHYETIVGRVMAAAHGVNQIGGWIGPCTQSNDLLRCELVYVAQLPPKHTIVMTANDVADMELNSDPLGACQQTYPVADYDPVLLDSTNPVDTIRIEKLNFSPSPKNPPEVIRMRAEGGPGKKPTIIYDASITFAIGPKSWKVGLRYDTPFIAAYPCHKGPHVIFCEYKYRLCKVDTLVDIHDWGARKGFRVRGSEAGSRVRSQTSDSEYDSEIGEDDGVSELEEVLVVEAYGVCDNAVFARSWCSYWGVSAVTADLKNTCFACCVRQAYAARVSVVILTDSAGMEYEVEEVDRLMENL